MPRTDRLVEMIRILRDGRLHRAEDLAARLGTSLRTIYRDMDRLIASGVPIEGRRGLGYRATAAVTLPPLNLTMTELEALHLGLAAVAQAEDAELREAARSLSARVDAVLPEDRDRAVGWSFATPPLGDAVAGFRHMASLRAAIRARQKLQFTLRDAPETQVLRPLRLDYWGRVWTLAGWNETTQGFAELRVDRIVTLRVLPQLFVDEPGRMLSDLEAGRGSSA
ncbi:helix-turn-helix transcriptional regulator [Limimaricola hongkongensis]|uniref:Transcriptional regulator, DeoR family n=1 Tax=Limimaricola hongkongensis DSM 17492 TaxID=1122180 RepID=A0A017H9X5_9RHOB|nr:WYL domain-containing protein [Limimaricola hongkongensis]EYD71317.1 Transcriptional regulator, DeoR family [Limimaricola hongkongensis DSM 17492]